MPDGFFLLLCDRAMRESGGGIRSNQRYQTLHWSAAEESPSRGFSPYPLEVGTYAEPALRLRQVWALTAAHWPKTYELHPNALA